MQLASPDDTNVCPNCALTIHLFHYYQHLQQVYYFSLIIAALNLGAH